MDLGLRQSWFHPQGASANSRPSAQTQTCCFSRGKKENIKTMLSDQSYLGSLRIWLCSGLWISTTMACPHVLLPLLWVVITSGFLTWCVLPQPKRGRKSEKHPEKDTALWKEERFEFVKHHHYHGLSFSVLDSITVRRRKIFMLDWSSAQYMNSRCSMSSWTVENHFSRRYTTFTKEKHGLKRKTWGGEA